MDRTRSQSSGCILSIAMLNQRSRHAKLRAVSRGRWCTKFGIVLDSDLPRCLPRLYSPCVTSTPQDHATSLRRHHSHQRDRIRSWIQQTDSHPTAAEIHEALLPEMSALSLGTVYRNLEVLVAAGSRAGREVLQAERSGRTPGRPSELCRKDNDRR